MVVMIGKKMNNFKSLRRASSHLNNFSSMAIEI